jgi:hypothetical protein
MLPFSHARSRTRKSHPDEARAMLAEIYNWFTEGFENADPKDAKALIDELNN